MESKLTFDQRKSKKNETSVTETTAAATTEVDVSTVMTVEVDLTETIEADDLSAMIVEITAAIGIAPSVTTTTSLSGRNAIDAVNQEETVVADQTIEDSNAEMTDVVATDLVAMTDAVVTEEETTARTTEWTATGIAPSATMTTLHGELNATNVELQRAAVEDDLLAEMTDVVATDLVATTDVVATEEGTNDAAERCSTTTTGIALNATTPISHSVRNATGVDYPEAVVNPVLVEMIGVVATAVAAMTVAAVADLVATTDVVATEEVAMTDVVATEEVAMTDVVATEEVAMTDVVATDVVATDVVAMTGVVATEAVAMTDVVATEAVATADHLAVKQENNANLENSGRLVGRDRAMPTTDHPVI
ncbi:hypothetical protein N9M40_00745 [Candidatus Poseidoniales archaeon]|nr:hypothetical protein [Candidatus Poseidoniales archaeon]MDA8724341.1 hypothetical protein [Candidatus Poseidoniales archaeon]